MNKNVLNKKNNLEINFVKVDATENQIKILYRLLKKRVHNISHVKIPKYNQHVGFVLSNPYNNWYIIYENKNPIGSLYTKYDNSIGLNITKQNKEIIRKIINFIDHTLQPNISKPSEIPTYFYINVPASNLKLQKILDELNIKFIQLLF